MAPEDIDRDVSALAEALLRRRAERTVRNVLLRPDVQEALRQPPATKLYAGEEEDMV